MLFHPQTSSYLLSQLFVTHFGRCPLVFFSPCTFRVQEIEGLKRALEGQGPYISRLEQQLEHYMNATSGQLGTSTGSNKRRSAIPLVIWTFFLSYPILK